MATEGPLCPPGPSRARQRAGPTTPRQAQNYNPQKASRVRVSRSCSRGLRHWLLSYFGDILPFSESGRPSSVEQLVPEPPRIPKPGLLKSLL